MQIRGRSYPSLSVPQSVKRREKVVGTPVQEQLPQPPLDARVVDVGDFGQAQKDDATLKTYFNRVQRMFLGLQYMEKSALC